MVGANDNVGATDGTLVVGASVDGAAVTGGPVMGANVVGTRDGIADGSREGLELGGSDPRTVAMPLSVKKHVANNRVSSRGEESSPYPTTGK